MWSASLSDRTYAGRIAGRVVGRLGNGVGVLAGDGGVVILEDVQLEGEARGNAAELLTTLSLTLGDG